MDRRMSLDPIDLVHQGVEGMICTFLLVDGEPALFDPGPATTLPRLRAALAERGMAVRDLRHLVLTHVHMDHAGAAGELVAENPDLAVHVHLDGLPHMANPARLIAASREIWGDAADVLWGPMRPVPLEALRPWIPGSPGRGPLRDVHPVATPGHIGHHVAYLLEDDGTLVVGDALGVVLGPAAPTHPKSPPPAVDLEAWRASVVEIRGLGARRAAFTHFGFHGDVPGRADRLEEELGALEARVLQAIDHDGMSDDERAFREETRAAMAAHVSDPLMRHYLESFDPVNDWRGVERYVRHQESAI
jgi:glyoxylase-like metal-dependent hydrolase (beta-lactamase superfamily II)